MSMKGRLLGGTALLMAAFSLNEVNAQTCTIPPTCAELGYDRTEGECSDAVKSLRCPLDKDKVFCLTAAEVEEIVGGGTFKKVAEIGDLVYLEGISAEPIPGRLPVGIVYDISGKMVSLAEYGKTDKCAEHTADGTTGWTLASMEDMGAIKANAKTINATIAKIGNNTPKLTLDGSHLSHDACYLASNGQACMNKDQALTSSSSYGCNYCQSGDYAFKSRCVRKFGLGGANDVVITTPEPTPAPEPEPIKYAVGDSYPRDGVALGTVVQVDSSGQHGVIAVSGGMGAATDASAACSAKTQGGLNWSIATGEHACQIAKNAGSCDADYDSSCQKNELSEFSPASGWHYVNVTCGLHTVGGQGRCLGSKWLIARSGQRLTSCDTTDSLGYVCEAPF